MKTQYTNYPQLILAMLLAMLGTQFDLNAQGCTPPNITSTTPGTRCGIGTTTLGATGDPGATLKWYAAATGGSSIGTGAVYTTPGLTSTTNFYVSATSVNAGSVAIGAGASVGNATPYNFTDGFFGGAKSQYIYTAAELTAAGLTAGNITGLTFSLTSVGSTLLGFAVQMGTTPMNAFGANANMIGGLATVYPFTNFNPVLGANTLNFSTPFNWNGTSNIIISISYSNNNGGNTTSAIRYDATSNNSGQSYRIDNQTASNIYSFTGSSGSGSFTVGKARPALRLNGRIICEGARTLVTASVSPAPALAVSPSASVCASVIKQLDVTSTLSDYDSYTWLPVSNLYTDAAATIPYAGGSATTLYYKSTGNSTQTYTVNANSSASGCAAMATTKITTSIPAINATASPTVICSGSPVNLNATGASGLSWQWNPGAVNSNTVLTTPANAGTTALMVTYTVTGTDPASTCSNSAVVSVSVNPLPSSPLGVNSTQCGLGVPTASVSGGSNYKWYATPTSTAVLQSGAATNYTSVIASTSTWYVSSVIGSCENSTRAEVTATVTPPDAVSAVASPTAVCPGESLALSATTAGSSSYTYTWTASPVAGSGISTSMTGASVMVTPVTSGSYQYLATASDGVCTTTAAVSVNVKSLPVVNATANPAQACSGSAVTLKAIGTGISWQWNPGGVNGNTMIVNLVNAGTSQLVSSYTATGTDPATGCSVTAVVTVSVSPDPVVSSTTPGSLCGSGTTTLGATSAASGATLKWYAASTGSTSIGTGSVFTTPTLTSTTSFYVSATSTSSSSAKMGAGSSAGNGVAYCFANASYDGAKTQYLYTAAELTAAGFGAGNITGLKFDLTAKGTGLVGFAVQMGTTAISAFPASANIQGGLTTVFPSTTFNPVVGVNTLNFSTPFNWDGVSNLIISVSWSNHLTSRTPSTIKYDATPNNASQMYRVNSQTPAALLAFTGSSGPGTFYVSKDRPSFTFLSVTNCEGSRLAVTASVNPVPALTLSPSSSVCFNAIRQLDVTSTLTNYDSYVWSPVSNLYTDAAATTPYAGTSASTVYYKSATANSQVYTVNAYNSASGCGTMANTQVTAISQPVVNATVTPGIVCSGEPVNLQATSTAVAAGTVAIGTGASATSGDWGAPTAFNSYDANYHTQAIYTAAELTAAGLKPGNITSISYRIKTLGDYSTTANYSVQCGATTATAFTDFISTAGFTPVFFAATHTHVVGINTITFTTPYLWDGVSNIVVDVMQEIGGPYTANTMSAETYYTQTAGDAMIYSTNNNTTDYGNPTNQRLNIIFNGQMASQAAGNYSWQWNPGAINSNTAVVNPVNTGAGASVSSYTVTGTDPTAGCSGTAVVTVTVNPLPAAPMAVNSTQCGLAIPTASVSGGSAYRWYATPTSTTVLQSGTSATYTGSINATTTWYVSAYNGTCESLRTAVTASVTAPDPITAMATSTLLCAGQSLTLTAAPTGTTSYTYTWTATPAAGSGMPAAVAAAIATVTPVSAGSYVYEVKAVNGVCTTTASVNVTMNALPLITASAIPTVICSGAPVNLSATGTGNLSWQWNPGAVNSNTTVVNPVNAGINPMMSSYTVTASNPATTCSNSAVVTVSVNPLPATPLATNSTQCGLAVPTASVSGGNTYKWYATPSSTTVLQSGASPTYTTSINATTTWYVSSYNANCESARTAVTVSVTTPDPVTASATSIQLCAGQSATLTAASTGSTNVYSYTWTASPVAGSGMPASVSSATTAVMPVTAGSYTYNVTARDGVCTTTASVSVTLNALPAISATASSMLVCSGSAVNLNATGAGSLSWQWNPGAINNNTVVVSPVNTGTAQSVSSYTVTGTNSATSCSATVVVSVSVNPVPAVTSTTPGSRCGGGPVSLGASSAPGAVLKWYTVPTGGLSIGTGSVFTTPTITTTTNYYVSAGSLSSGTVAIGAGANSGNSLAYNFASSFSGGSKAQYLYTAAELINAGLGAGNINSLKFNLTATGANLSGFMVQMGTTALNTFPASADIQGGLSTVYPATTYTPVVGANTLNFSTPYNWDGVSNVIISISWSNNNTYNAASSITYDATSNYASQIYIQTNASPATMAAFTGSVAGSMSLYTSKARPAFTLSGNLICESPRSLVTASVSTAPALTISASGSVCANAIKQLDVTSPLAAYDSYTWSPVSNLYADAAATTPYTGASATTVYYKSTSTNSQLYTVNASNSASGCAAVATTDVSAAMPVVNASASPSVVCSGTPVNLVATTSIVVTGTVGIGAGSSQTSGGWSEPTAFNSYNANYHTQAVYTAAELTAAGLRAGNITAVAYNISTQGSYSTTANYAVRCGSTTATAFTDFISNAGFTTVYAAATHTHVVGQNTIAFTTPYLWDGVSNIIVDVSQDIGGPYTANTTSAKTYYTQTAGNTMVFATNNNTTANGNPTNKRLNLLFTGQAVTQAASNLTWQWNPGAVNSSSMAVTPLNTGAAGSSATYTVTVLDPATTCTNSAVVTLTVNPVPSLTVAASSPSLCSGTSANLTAAGAVSYSWMPVGGSSNVAVVSPSVSTIYTVTGTSLGCSSTNTLSLSVTATPTITTASASPSVICTGATVSLTATGATNYTWSPVSATTASVALTPTASTVYTVSSENMGCIHTRTLSVTVNSAPTLAVSGNSSALCATAATATLTASGTATAYAWNNGASTASIVVTPSATTSYTVSGSNSCGTTSTVATVSVATTPTMVATTASSLICAGNVVVLTASATPGVAYSWSTGAITPSISVSPAGTITYTVTGTNACGSATATVLQIVSPCTGIEEMGDEGEIRMFPNPANDYITLEIPASLASEGAGLEVTDALGKLVMKEVLNTDVTTVDLRKLEDGVYFFKVSHHNRAVKTGKVVKW